MRRLSRLLSDWMLVKLDPARERTKGGIVLLDPASQPIRTGTVLMAGPGRRYSDKFVPMPEGIVGTRVAFMIDAAHTKSGQTTHQLLQLDNEHELIRLGDVLLEVGEDVEVSK